MLDHFAIGVRDLAASRAFYEAALAPLGFGVVMERDDRVALGPTARPIFWLVDREPTSAIHIAFQADSRERVDAFHEAAWPPAGATTATPACAPTTTRTTTARSSSTRTATTPRPSATRPDDHARLPPAARHDARRPAPARPVPRARLPGAQRRPDARDAARRVDVPDRRRGRARSASGPGTSSRRSRRTRRPSTSTASPRGRSSTRAGRACRSTRCWRASSRSAAT